MRYVFILPSLVIGGAEMNTIKLANNLTAKGYEIFIIIVFSRNDFKNRLNKKVKVIDLKCKRLLEYVFKIKKIVLELNPNALIINLWPVTFLSILSFIPDFNLIRKTTIVEHINLRLGLKDTSYLEKILEYVFHLISVYFVNAFIGVSPGVSNSLRKIPTISKNRILTIPNPIYKENEIEIGPIKSYKNTPKNLKLLAVGNYKPQKDYPTMFKVVKELLDIGINVELKVAGDGQLRDSYQELILDLKIEKNVTLLGVVQDVKKLYKWADIYLMTSQWEGFGNTIAEALSFGCRCVATNCPSGPSFILKNGKYGGLAKVGDTISIRDTILCELKTKREVKDFLESVNDYSVEKVTERYLRVLS